MREELGFCARETLNAVWQGRLLEDHEQLHALAQGDVLVFESRQATDSGSDFVKVTQTVLAPTEFAHALGQPAIQERADVQSNAYGGQRLPQWDLSSGSGAYVMQIFAGGYACFSRQFIHREYPLVSGDKWRIPYDLTDLRQKLTGDLAVAMLTQDASSYS